MKKKYQKGHMDFESGWDVFSSIITICIAAAVLLTFLGIIFDNPWLMSFIRPVIQALVL